MRLSLNRPFFAASLMTCVLRYGADSGVEMEFPEGVLLAECGNPTVSPSDPAAAVAEALAEPLDYPTLARSTMPSDHVVVALERGVPRAAEVVAAVVRGLVDAGVHADGVTVLRTAADAAAEIGDPVPRLPARIGRRIRLLTHDPNARHSLAYLAAGRDGTPILLNRTLTDADVVVPIGCIQARTEGGYAGIASHVFPSFSDYRTLSRFRAGEIHFLRIEQRRKLTEEVRQVGWLLGLTFAIQVVPGPGDRILHVLAGETSAVLRRARALYRAAWQCSVPRRARLVIATIEGGAAQQTWSSVGRAVAAAHALVEDGGAIAVCCELDRAPGPAVEQLAKAESRHEAMRLIRKAPPDDALAAMQIAQALDHAKIYLLSRLEHSLVEDLQIAPLAGTDELRRLTRRYASCIVLSNACRAMVRKEAED